MPSDLILVSLAASVLIASPAGAADCLHFGETVTLAGNYAPAVLAESGSGNEAPAGITGRTADLLMLQAPVCVAADVVSAGVPVATDIQILCPDLVAASGQAISVTGRLVGAHSGNGHTPVLLVCRS